MSDLFLVMLVRNLLTVRIRIVVRILGVLLGDSCGLSDCVPQVSFGVAVVIDGLVSPSSLVVMSEALLSDSDWEIVESQSFSFSGTRQAVCLENQEHMNYDGTLVKAPPVFRRKIFPPTLQQSLHPSIEAVQLQTEVEGQESDSYEMEYEGQHRWPTRDRTVIARMAHYLNENDNMRVEIEELEFLLGPEDSEEILRYARRTKGGRIFEIFGSNGSE